MFLGNGGCRDHAGFQTVGHNSIKSVKLDYTLQAVLI